MTPTVDIKEIANRFADKLCAALTPEQWAEMLDKNATNPVDVCASHDYVDANEFMMLTLEETPNYEYGLYSDEDDMIWNQAWAVAKAERLTRK